MHDAHRAKELPRVLAPAAVVQGERDALYGRGEAHPERTEGPDDGERQPVAAQEHRAVDYGFHNNRHPSDVEVELGVVLVFVLRRRGASVIGLLCGERGVRRTNEGLVDFPWKLDGDGFRFEQAYNR